MRVATIQIVQKANYSPERLLTKRKVINPVLRECLEKYILPAI